MGSIPDNNNKRIDRRDIDRQIQTNEAKMLKKDSTVDEIRLGKQLFWAQVSQSILHPNAVLRIFFLHKNA